MAPFSNLASVGVETQTQTQTSQGVDVVDTWNAGTTGMVSQADSALGSVVTGTGTMEIDEPDTVPIPYKQNLNPKPKSSSTAPQRVGNAALLADDDVSSSTTATTTTTTTTTTSSTNTTIATPDGEIERGRLPEVRGSAILSAAAAKRRKKKKAGKLKGVSASAIASPVVPPCNTVRGFTPTPMDLSAAEDSDASSARGSPKVMSPKTRLNAIAGVGASPRLRAQSPGVSSLKLQLDALNLRSTQPSRSSSASGIRSNGQLQQQQQQQQQHQPDSEVTDSGASAAGGSDTAGEEVDDLVSYHVKIDQAFISQSMAEEEEAAVAGGDGGGSDSSSAAGNITSVTSATLDMDQRASSMIVRKMTADDFTTIRCLGDGAFGTVHLVKHKVTGRLYAQKQLTKAHIKVHKKRVECTMSERQILELVNRHPFIVNLYYAFQDHEKLYLILEYACGGELFRHLEMEKFFSEDVAAFYIAEIVLALDYLHNTVGVIYRDLKPENCLLDASGHLLLTDFGLSKVAVEDASTPGGSRCNSLGVGTIEYMAPEIVRNSNETSIGPGYGKACDWWSLGAMACDLMTGKPPFGGGNWTKIQQNIMHQKLCLPYFLSPDAKDLLTRLLRKEPRKRLGVAPNDLAVIKKHRFFRKIDWAKLESRELEAPIKPLVTDPEAAENFDRAFTERAIDVEQQQQGVRHSRTLSKNDPFGGFSYVASTSMLMEESILSELDWE